MALTEVPPDQSPASSSCSASHRTSVLTRPWGDLNEVRPTTRSRGARWRRRRPCSSSGSGAADEIGGDGRIGLLGGELVDAAVVPQTDAAAIRSAPGLRVAPAPGTRSEGPQRRARWGPAEPPTGREHDVGGGGAEALNAMTVFTLGEGWMSTRSMSIPPMPTSAC